MLKDHIDQISEALENFLEPDEMLRHTEPVRIEAIRSGKARASASPMQRTENK